MFGNPKVSPKSVQGTKIFAPLRFPAGSCCESSWQMGPVAHGGSQFLFFTASKTIDDLEDHGRPVLPAFQTPHHGQQTCILLHQGVAHPPERYSWCSHICNLTTHPRTASGRFHQTHTQRDRAGANPLNQIGFEGSRSCDLLQLRLLSYQCVGVYVHCTNIRSGQLILQSNTINHLFRIT